MGLSDPGLFRRVRRKPDDEGRGVQDQYIWSQQGQSWRPPTALYSRDCNVIINHFDHTCPWTGTAIVVGKTAVATGAALASAGGGPLMDVYRWSYLRPGQGAP